MTDPIGNLSGYWQLFTKLADREYVVNNATSSAFLDHMLDYPGGVMRDVILKFWIDNELSTGKIQLGQKVADLANVQSALLTFAGSNDNIVTADAIEPLLKLVNSTDKEFVLVPGGHMGIVSGSKAIETIWKKTSEWLSERSD
jgi:polyhydroxyalkanoate synthase